MEHDYPGTKTWAHRTTHHLVFAHGRRFTLAPPPPGLRKMPGKACYANAAHYALTHHQERAGPRCTRGGWSTRRPGRGGRVVGGRWSTHRPGPDRVGAVGGWSRCGPPADMEEAVAGVLAARAAETRRAELVGVALRAEDGPGKRRGLAKRAAPAMSRTLVLRALNAGEENTS